MCVWHTNGADVKLVSLDSNSNSISLHAAGVKLASLDPNSNSISPQGAGVKLVSLHLNSNSISLQGADVKMVTLDPELKGLLPGSGEEAVLEAEPLPEEADALVEVTLDERGLYRPATLSNLTTVMAQQLVPSSHQVIPSGYTLNPKSGDPLGINPKP